MKAKQYTKETIAGIGIHDRGFAKFKVGDCVQVGQNIKEGDKERVQMFEGDVIAIRNHGISTTFTVRRIDANSIAVERIFPYYSPAVAYVKHVHHGDSRRAKLYYMRYRIGKAARVAEKVLTKEQKQAARKQQEKASV